MLLSQNTLTPLPLPSSLPALLRQGFARRAKPWQAGERVHQRIVSALRCLAMTKHPSVGWVKRSTTHQKREMNFYNFETREMYH